MNEQDIISLILGEPEDDFHGTVPSKDKPEAGNLAVNYLRGHAGALMHHTHGNLNIQEPLETRRSACLTLDVPLPVVVLNEYVRKHFSMLMELSDSVSLSNAGGRLRIKCTVCGLWEE